MQPDPGRFVYCKQTGIQSQLVLVKVSEKMSFNINDQRLLTKILDGEGEGMKLRDVLLLNDPKTNFKKKSAYDTIAEQYNAVSENKKTSQQIRKYLGRKKLEVLKELDFYNRDVRRYRAEKNRTGGGPALERPATPDPDRMILVDDCIKGPMKMPEVHCESGYFSAVNDTMLSMEDSIYKSKKQKTKGAMKMMPSATVTSDILEEPLEPRRRHQTGGSSGSKEEPTDMIQNYYMNQEERERRRMELEEEKAARDVMYHEARMETEKLRQQLLSNQIIPIEYVEQHYDE